MHVLHDVVQIKVVPAPVASINFENPTKGKKKARLPREDTVLPAMLTRDELLHELYEVRPTAAVFRVVPGYFSRSAPHREQEPNLPTLLTSLYDVKYKTYTTDACKNIFSQLKV